MTSLQKIIIFGFVGSILISSCSGDEKRQTSNTDTNGYADLSSDTTLEKPIVIENTIKEEPKTEYQLLVEESELIGAWKMLPSRSWSPITSITIEFYSKGNTTEYYFVWKESAIPKINKYARKGNKFMTDRDDYYIVTKSGNLKSYDSEGFIGEDSGFKLVKIESN